MLDGNDYEDEREQCIEEECRCECHADIFRELGVGQAGAFIDEDGEEFLRQGVFPFLALPTELRDTVYGYAFLQDGNGRHSRNHRGTIHTALLRTCRQIYNEAGHLPLTLNRPCFGGYGATSMLDFVGFALTQRTRPLVTGAEIEMQPMTVHNPNWLTALKRLSTLSITDLKITFTGPYTGEQIKSHRCILEAFSVFEGLKTFEVDFVSYAIAEGDKQALSEEFKAKLLKNHPSKSKSKSAHLKAHQNRAARNAGGPSTDAFSIKRKGSIEKPNLSKRRNPPRKIAKRSTEDMLQSYEQLKAYAVSLDAELTGVKIRLENARQAAETGNQAKFGTLFKSISSTLDEQFMNTSEQFNKITAARNAMSAPSVTTEANELCAEHCY